ncbi:MAG: glycosyltransferase involved in cell wall biosynthesis [Lentimonas sp.]|jgi:glycosyltransferase involved in cell wall biosynthesis
MSLLNIMDKTKNHIPLISVILPVYNAEEYLVEAIESVLNQSFSDFLLIVINDGSTDASKEIIHSFSDKRIVYVENEMNLGLIKTLNKGLDIAEGKYIARMDADDICYSDRFEKQFSFLELNEKHILCGGWAKRIDRLGNMLGAIKRIDSNDLLHANLLFTNPFVHPTIMFRKEMLKGLYYNEEAVYCEDLEFWIRISMETSFKIGNIPEYLLKYRWHESNVSVQNKKSQLETHKTIISEKVNTLVSELNQSNSEIHFLLFSQSPKSISTDKMLSIKKWMKTLIDSNKSKNIVNHNALVALLLSRWVVLCLKRKSILCLLKSGLPVLNGKILYSTFRLLRFK